MLINNQLIPHYLIPPVPNSFHIASLHPDLYRKLHLETFWSNTEWPIFMVALKKQLHAYIFIMITLFEGRGRVQRENILHKVFKRKSENPRQCKGYLFKTTGRVQTPKSVPCLHQLSSTTDKLVLLTLRSSPLQIFIYLFTRYANLSSIRISYKVCLS